MRKADKNMRKARFNPKGFHMNQIPMYLVLVPLALFMSLPIVFIINHAFKPIQELFAFPPKFFVENPVLDNFVKLGRQASSGGIVYQSKVTSKQLGQYYDTDIDAFRRAYDGKTVTVTGKLTGKSPKMLYVELATGTKVPMRVYLESEEQRTQFNALKEGSTITVKGSLGILYPQSMDAGGFQEMANGLIALDSVTLVK